MYLLSNDARGVQFAIDDWVRTKHIIKWQHEIYQYP
jgi:hypothetical protein